MSNFRIIRLFRNMLIYAAFIGTLTGMSLSFHGPYAYAYEHSAENEINESSDPKETDLERDEENARQKMQAVQDKYEKIYQDAMKQILKDGNEAPQVGIWERIFQIPYDMYHAIANIAPYMGALSMFFGGLYAFLIRENRAKYKNVILTFVIGVPVFLILFVFVVGMIV